MITRRRNEFEGDPFGMSAGGQRCFTCGQFVTNPAIMWSGFVEGSEGSGNIYFHPRCMLEWIPKMKQEADDLITISQAGAAVLMPEMSTSTST